MTCIVVVSDSRTVLLGGDSAAASDRGVFIRATRKVFRAGAYAIGFTRSWRMGQILRHETELPEPPDTRDGEELENPGLYRGGSGDQWGVPGWRARIFEVHDDYHVVRPATPYFHPNPDDFLSDLRPGKLGRYAVLRFDLHVEYCHTEGQAVQRLKRLKHFERVAIVDRRPASLAVCKATTDSSWRN